MPPIPSKETGDRQTRPSRFLLGFGGERNLFLEDDMLNTRRHDRGGLVVVHDDGGNDQECHVGVGASVGFPAGELAVMPGGMSQNRNVDRENGTRAGIGRSSQVCCTSNRKILGEFRLGAGLRYRDPPDSSVSNPTRILSALRSPSGVARWKVLGALALQELIALARPRWRRACSRRRSLPWGVAR